MLNWQLETHILRGNENRNDVNSLSKFKIIVHRQNDAFNRVANRS